MIKLALFYMGWSVYWLLSAIILWEPILSWIGIVIYVFCIAAYVFLIDRELKFRQRRELMKRHTCDLCDGDLYLKPEEGRDILTTLLTTFEVFKVKHLIRIVGFKVDFPFGARQKDMDICSKCMTDFKEYIQRKKSYLSGEKK